MRRSLALGLRLAVGGGREGVVRLVFVASGVSLGVVLLLLSLSFPRAFVGRFDRSAWQDGAYAVLYPEEGRQLPDEAPDGALFLAVSDYYDGRPMTRAYYAALGPEAAVPPGLERAPRPGEVAVSPALRRLMASLPADQLADRFPGRATLTIGPAGLAHPDELVGIIGRTPDELRSVHSVAIVHDFAAVSSARLLVRVLGLALLQAGLLVLIPVAVLIGLVSRVAWRQRERRLAAIRLVGATQSQIALVAAAEAGLGAATGAVLGWGLFEAARRLISATMIFQYGHFWLEDLSVPAWWLALVLLGTPALVTLVTVASLRHVRSRPLSVQRRGPRRRPSAWLTAPLLVGIGGQLALLTVRDRPAAVSALLTLCTVVGFVLAGPSLVALLGGAVARLSRRVPGLLAARRIAADPAGTFAAVAAVGLAALALAFIGSTAAVPRPPDSSSMWREHLHPGVIAVATGGVAAETVAPLLQRPGVETARAGNRVDELFLSTDGSIEDENRIRTEVANLIPNAIINGVRDPLNQDLAGFARDFDRLGGIAAFFVLVIGALGLAAATLGGLIERRRPFALLRASGVSLGELRRSVFLESAMTMVVASAVGVGVGMVLALLASRQSAVDWQWPEPSVYGFVGGGVLVGLAFSALALSLLSVTTRPDAVRFE